MQKKMKCGIKSSTLHEYVLDIGHCSLVASIALIFLAGSYAK